jgi:uroporphyrinogen-III synthase
VVITRPAAQTRRWRPHRRAGPPVVELPLLEISPLPEPTARRWRACAPTPGALVAFVSPNAIDAAFAHLDHWPAGVKLAVLGEGSRAALAKHGIRPGEVDIVSPAADVPSDTEHLLQALDLTALQRPARADHPRRQRARTDGRRPARAAGAVVDVVPAYRRQCRNLTPALAARCAVCWRAKRLDHHQFRSPARPVSLLAEMDLRHPDAMQQNALYQCNSNI